MLLEDAILRMNEVLAISPLADPENNAHPDGASVALEDVTYHYAEDENAAADHISIKAKAGSIFAQMVRLQTEGQK